MTAQYSFSTFFDDSRLTKELPALRGAAKATQDEIANAIGVSRQTYNAVEMQKRKKLGTHICH